MKSPAFYGILWFITNEWSDMKYFCMQQNMIKKRHLLHAINYFCSETDFKLKNSRSLLNFKYICSN
jgi:hypothetical protein